MTAIDLVCVRCGAIVDARTAQHRCSCGGTLDVVAPLQPLARSEADRRRGSTDPLDRSGVWRFRERLVRVPRSQILTSREGDTPLYDVPSVARWIGLDRLQLKHEGHNPTGSFKDRGMTVAATVARGLGFAGMACASTGNTSASMAAYAARAGMRATVLVPRGGVSLGKLAQAMAYGATTIEISGDFDRAMALIPEVCAARSLYLVNSVNPFRIEGQKTVAHEILQDRGWVPPDWIVLPGGNLGNASALAAGLADAHQIGWIDRLPRIAVVQAQGASPLFDAFHAGRDVTPVVAETVATAIRIGAPVSWRKALRGLAATRGTVVRVTDQQIVDAKARVDRAGIGAEPASCATVAGIAALVADGTVARGADVVGILTGHLLKDPGLVVDYHAGTLTGLDRPLANPPVQASATLDGILSALADREGSGGPASG